MLELAILIPLSLWLIDQSIKGRAANEQQNMAIKELAYSIKEVATSLQHHVAASQLNQAHMADLIDKIWNKVE